MKYYLTETIYIENNSMYQCVTHNKSIKLTRNNWHHILSEYGWEKIPLIWIKRLNKLSTMSFKNSCYGVLDCEGDGDCFFHCIANSLNEKNRSENNTETYEEYNSQDIRTIIANSITDEMYDTLITYYRIMKDADDFDEEWDPYEIQDIEDFRKQIKQSGNNYWGDYLLLNSIINILKLNIFILNCDDSNKNYSIYNTLNEYNINYNSIYLLYENNCHFKLIGYFNGDMMITNFKNDTIPEGLLKLYNINR